MLVVSGLFFLVFVALAVTGEAILPLYGGDQALAARGSKASFALTLGLALAFAQPALWTWFGGRLNGVVAQGSSDTWMKDFVLSGNFKSGVEIFSWLLFALFLAATLFLSWHLWQERM